MANKLASNSNRGWGAGSRLLLRLFMGTALAVSCAAAALIPNSKAAEAPLAYVGCGLQQGTAPSHLCKLSEGGEFGAFFKSQAETTYVVCVEFPGGEQLCTNPQNAAAETLYVNKITTSLTGRHRVTWLVGGQQVASWSFQVPLEPPEFGKTVVLRPLSGTVLVKTPRGFQPLDSATAVRLGTVVDARRGEVRLQAASSPGGSQQYGRFRGGVFRVGQGEQRSRVLGGPGAPSVLKLVGEPPACSHRASFSSGAPASASGSRGGRRLWGNAHGNVQTGGRYATVTVRGTRWLTEDTCGGTLVRVVRGAVSVRDLPRRRTVLLRAPGRLLVHPLGGRRQSR